MKKHIFIIALLVALFPAIDAAHVGGGHGGGHAVHSGGGRSWSHGGGSWRGGGFRRGGGWGGGRWWGGPSIAIGVPFGGDTYIEQPIVASDPFTEFQRQTGLSPINNRLQYRDWLFATYSPNVAQSWWNDFLARYG